MVKKKNNQKKKATPRRRRATPFLKTLSAPAAMGTVQSSGAGGLPLSLVKGTSAFVKNFELMRVFSAAGGFATNSLVGNPGISGNFPWLATIASGYQKFRFLYFRAFFSTNTSTQAQGTAFTQIIYDNLDTDPSTLAQVMAGDSASAGPVWYGGAVNEQKAFDMNLSSDANVFVDLDTKRLNNNWYYVRATGATVSTGTALTGVIPAGLTLSAGNYIDQTSYPFKLFFGSNNCNINGTPVSPGNLYGAYIIEFAEPVAAALQI